ncbi:hypothetical protein QR680_013627 [Steinernema hermaphroditum]|uniref:Uncharacterized protein n=1 Tax=Steinernema hermaphroditum TaxID=289476 RepID=A0AA39I8R5_9BILA|nr:hypothetical protein QR680_013627 [Steinernema hermaphroditum]
MGSEEIIAITAFCSSTILATCAAILSAYIFFHFQIRFHNRTRGLLKKVNLVEAHLKQQAYSDDFWNHVGKQMGITAEQIKADRDLFVKSLTVCDATLTPKASSQQASPKIPSQQNVQAGVDDPNYRTMLGVQDCFLATAKSNSKGSAEPNINVEKSKEAIAKASSNGADSGYEALDVLNDNSLMPPPPQ